MSRTKKIRILIPIVIILFFGAYGMHLHKKKEMNITGRLPIKAINEASGIAASGINKDLYYIHNDSGDTSRFFSL